MKGEEWESLYIYAKSLADARKSFDEIEQKLKQRSDDQQLITEMLTQIKKVKNAVKAKNGRYKIGFGALFLFSGFLITFINYQVNESFTIVMYSFTSVGLILMFLGLYDIIG